MAASRNTRMQENLRTAPHSTVIPFGGDDTREQAWPRSRMAAALNTRGRHPHTKQPGASITKMPRRTYCKPQSLCGVPGLQATQEGTHTWQVRYPWNVESYLHLDSVSLQATKNGIHTWQRRYPRKLKSYLHLDSARPMFPYIR